MLKILDVKVKTDSHGKLYHLLDIYQPEILPLSAFAIKRRAAKGLPCPKPRRSKRCGYIAYPVDYTKHQGHDYGYNFKKGDEVEGRLVTKKVLPYMVNGAMKTRCTVPVFCSDDDPIEFEVKMEEAIKRAGRVLATGQLKFGETEKPEEMETTLRIPENCLIVKEYKNFKI